MNEDEVSHFWRHVVHRVQGSQLSPAPAIFWNFSWTTEVFRKLERTLSKSYMLIFASKTSTAKNPLSPNEFAINILQIYKHQTVWPLRFKFLKWFETLKSAKKKATGTYKS